MPQATASNIQDDICIPRPVDPITALKESKAAAIDNINTLILDMERVRTWITDARSIDRFMVAKSYSMNTIAAALTLSTGECPFCRMQGYEATRVEACANCEYGKKYGLCCTEGSAFHRYAVAMDALQDAIDGYWIINNNAKEELCRPN